MPQMANITVKDKNGADLSLNAVSPSSGDKSPAIWRADSIHGVPLFRPTYRVTATYNGPRDARRVTITGEYPVPNDILGTVLARIPFRFEITMPQALPSDTVDNAVVIAQNFLKSSLVTEILQSGFNAT